MGLEACLEGCVSGASRGFREQAWGGSNLLVSFTVRFLGWGSKADTPVPSLVPRRAVFFLVGASSSESESPYTTLAPQSLPALSSSLASEAPAGPTPPMGVRGAD